MPSLSQRAFAEGLGTAFLLAAVVGSGIMAQKPSGGNDALALVGNTLPTGAILIVLILIFGPISGAHFNPEGRAAGSQGQSSPCHRRRTTATHPRFELGSWKDAVSATRRFESSRPSQPAESLPLVFRYSEAKKTRTRNHAGASQ